MPNLIQVLIASSGAITSCITPCNVLKFSSQGHRNTLSPTHSANPTHPTQPTYPTHSTHPAHSTHPTHSTHFISPTHLPLLFTQLLSYLTATYSTYLTHLSQPSSSAHFTLSFKSPYILNSLHSFYSSYSHSILSFMQTENIHCTNIFFAKLIKFYEICGKNSSMVCQVCKLKYVLG